MAAFLYGLCTLTALACCWLLLRAYVKSGYKLLLWGGLCFAGLTLNNGLLVVDRLILGPTTNLFLMRLLAALLSILVLLYGILWDAD
jgi:hypothetical protein